MKLPYLDPEAIRAKVYALHRDGGPAPGDPPGWECVDRLYTVATGQWTVVTGTPQSGKSEFLDAMMVNLAERGWHFAIYSPENWPVQTHVAKLAEKHARKPFGPGRNKRIDQAELAEVTSWVLEHFAFLQPDGDATPENLLSLASAYRPGCVGKRFGIALDPWNTLDHIRPPSMSETDYVSLILSIVKKLVQMGDTHCWLVVHPAKLLRARSDGKFPVPHPYDISGSAHWYNKPDNILCIHREKTEGNDRVEIHVQKVRFKHIGHIGMAELCWDKVTGRYFEAPAVRLRDPTSRDGYEHYRDPEARYG